MSEDYRKWYCTEAGPTIGIGFVVSTKLRGGIMVARGDTKHLATVKALIIAKREGKAVKIIDATDSPSPTPGEHK